MMFTKGEDLNILDDDHFVVVLVEYGVVDDVPQVLLVALCKIHHGCRITMWCLQQAFSLWIFPNAF